MIALRFAHRAGQPTFYWLSGGAGLAGSLLPPGNALGVDVRGEFVAERVIVEAENPMGEGTASAGVWRFGGRLGVDVLLRVARGFWVLAGADASLMGPRVYVDVGGSEVGFDPPVGWTGSLGLRLVP